MVLSKAKRKKPATGEAPRARKRRKTAENEAKEDRHDGVDLGETGMTPEREKSETKLTPEVDAVKIVDGLREAQPVDALRELAAADEELMEAFLSLCGQPADILRILAREDKAKSQTVAVLFNAVEALMLHIARGGGKHKTFALELTRHILQEHIRYVVLLLSASNTAYQVKSTLKMLTAMVACGPSTAKEVLLKLDFEHKNFEAVINRRNQDSSVDVRTSYVHFMLSFLFAGDTAIIKEFLEKKTKFSQIFPGFSLDSCSTVTLVLATLKDKLLLNPSLSKTSKMKLFSVYNLKPLWALFQWKGPKESMSSDVTEREDDAITDQEQVAEAVQSFFETALTSTKLGLVFHDPTVGSSGQNQNHLLQSLLQSVTAPWERPREARLVCSALKHCPDQLRPYLAKIEKVWGPPRNSTGWFQIVDFVISLVEEQTSLPSIVSAILNSEGDSKVKLGLNVAANLGLPEALFRDIITPSLIHEAAGVRARAAYLLKLTVVERLRKMTKCSSPAFKRQLLARVRERLPGPKPLKAFWLLEITWLKEKLDSGDDEMLQPLANFVQALDFLLTSFPQKYELAVDAEKMLVDVEETWKNQGSSTVSTITLFLLKRIANTREGKDVSQRHVSLLISLCCSCDLEKEAKLVALEALEIMLRKAGYADLPQKSLELRVWVSFLCPERDSDLCQHLPEVLCTSCKSEEFELQENQHLSSLTRVLLSDPVLLRKKKYTEQTIPALLAIQEDPRALADLVLSRKSPKMDPRSREVAKLVTEDAPPFGFSSDMKHADAFSSTLRAMELLTNCKVTKEDFLRHKEALESFVLDLENADLRREVAGQVLRQDCMRRTFALLTSTRTQWVDLAMSLLSIVGNLGEKNENPGQDGQQLVEDYKELFLKDLFSTSTLKVKFEKSLSLDIFKFTDDELCQILFASLTASGETRAEIELLRLTRHSLDEIASRRILLEENWLKTVCELCMKSLEEIKTRTEEASRCLKDFCESFARFLDTYPHCDLVPSLDSSSVVVWCLQHLDASEALLQSLVSRSHEMARCLIIHWSKNEMQQDFQKLFRPLLKALKLLKGSRMMSNEDVLLFLVKLRPVTLGFLNGDTDLLRGQELFEILELLCFQRGVVSMKDILGLDFRLKRLPKAGTASQMKVLLTVVDAGSNNENKKSQNIANHVLLPSMRLARDNLKKCVAISSQECSEEAAVAYGVVQRCVEALNPEACLTFWEKSQETCVGFVRSTLKYSLRPSVEPSLRAISLDALTKVFVAFCKIKSSSPKTDFDHGAAEALGMVYGHSGFVAALLDGTSDVAKTSLANLVDTLSILQPTASWSQHVPMFLGAYGGTLAASDQAILRVLYRYGDHLPSFSPILWSQSAISHYSVLGNQTSSSRAGLWKVPKTSEILALVDPDKMSNTSINFPLKMSLVPSGEGSDDHHDDPKIYDHRFFLPLICQVCAPGVFVDRHLRLIETGCLSMALASLSSWDELTRSVGYLVLSRIYSQLETAKLTAEKRIWLHLVDIVRNGVSSYIKGRREKSLTVNGEESTKETDSKKQSDSSDSSSSEDEVDSDHDNEQQDRLSSSTPTRFGGSSFLRLPPLITTFLVKAIPILRSPLDPLYQSLSDFILAKPSLDPRRVPNFLRLFYATSKAERHFILSVMADGIKDRLDVDTCRKDRVMKTIMCHHGSPILSDPEGRRLIRRVLKRTVMLTQPAFDLVRQEGLLLWLITQLRIYPEDHGELLSIAETAWEGMTSAMGEKCLPAAMLADFSLFLTQAEVAAKDGSSWTLYQRLGTLKKKVTDHAARPQLEVT